MSTPTPMPLDFMFLADESVTTPSYFIYRDIAPGEPFDPTSPPVFWPPKDSDELFDALRAEYPHINTHADRMRDAIIDFLIAERESERASAIPAVTSSATPTTWPSGSSVSTPSFDNSPEIYNLSTPTSFGIPSHVHRPHHSTEQATSGSTCQQSPPSLDDMTTVFSIAASNQPKQRIRRKMTAAEKVDYRNRRMVKACEKCAKRKRKCIHNRSAATDKSSSSSPQATHKSTRTSTTNTINTPAHPKTSHVSSSSSYISDLTNLCDFSPLVDLDMVMDQTLAEPAIDDTCRFDDFGYLDCDPGNWRGDWWHDVGASNTTTKQQPTGRGKSQDFELFNSSNNWDLVEVDKMDSLVLALPDRLDADAICDTQVDFTDDHKQQNNLGGHLEKVSPRHLIQGHDLEYAETSNMTEDQLTLGQTTLDQSHQSEMEHVRSPRRQDQAQSRERENPRRRSLSVTEFELPFKYSDVLELLATTEEAFAAYDKGTGDPHHRNLTLGEGVTELTDPSGEMRMLRRRIPRALHSIVDRNNGADIADTAEKSDGLSLQANAVLQSIPQSDMLRLKTGEVEAGMLQSPVKQANGGAYPRLASSSAGSVQIVSLSMSPTFVYASTTDTPTQTRPPASSSHAGNLDTNGGITTVHATDRLEDRKVHKHHHGRNLPPHVDRLCDYFYVKDHNGRENIPNNSARSAANMQLMLSPLILAAISLLALAFFSHTAANPLARPHALFAVLACLQPVPTTKSTKLSTEGNSVWPSILRCSIANSAWLKTAFIQDLMDPQAESPAAYSYHRAQEKEFSAWGGRGEWKRVASGRRS